MTERKPILRLWLHMSCRYWLERGRWLYVCDNCQAIARPTGGK